MPITLFTSITMIFGVDNIMRNIIQTECGNILHNNASPKEHYYGFEYVMPVSTLNLIKHNGA